MYLTYSEMLVNAINNPGKRFWHSDWKPSEYIYWTGSDFRDELGELFTIDCVYSSTNWEEWTDE